MEWTYGLQYWNERTASEYFAFREKTAADNIAFLWWDWRLKITYLCHQLMSAKLWILTADSLQSNIKWNFETD